MQALQILLVEDNPADAELAIDTLEHQKILVRVTHAVDGIEALQMLRGEGRFRKPFLPDLIVLDLNLPQKSGREVLSELKADPLLRMIPVVVLTSSQAERDLVETYAAGANCYVIKPIGLEEFREIVRAVEEFWFAVVRLPSRPSRETQAMARPTSTSE